jgi:hypothetical protein
VGSDRGCGTSGGQLVERVPPPSATGNASPGPGMVAEPSRGALGDPQAGCRRGRDVIFREVPTFSLGVGRGQRCAAGDTRSLGWRCRRAGTGSGQGRRGRPRACRKAASCLRRTAAPGPVGDPRAGRGRRAGAGAGLSATRQSQLRPGCLCRSLTVHGSVCTLQPVSSWQALKSMQGQLSQLVLRDTPAGALAPHFRSERWGGCSGPLAERPVVGLHSPLGWSLKAGT